MTIHYKFDIINSYGRRYVYEIIIICLISLSVLIVGSILFFSSKYAISLNGEEVVKVEVGKEYKELGAKSIIDFKNIKTSGKVNTKKNRNL